MFEYILLATIIGGAFIWSGITLKDARERNKLKRAREVSNAFNRANYLISIPKVHTNKNIRVIEAQKELWKKNYPEQAELIENYSYNLELKLGGL